SYTTDPINITSSAMYAELGTFQVSSMVDDAPAGPALSYQVTDPLTVVPTFVDVTNSAGVGANIPGHLCSSYTAGAAWGDVLANGSLDLYVPNRTASAKLFMNDGTGHFTDEAAARGVAVTGGLGAVFVDYDNDGHEDLAVSGTNGFHLYRNDGTGHFTDVTQQAGLTVPGPGPQSSAWGDFNGDGYLDVYVVDYLDCTKFNGMQDHLFRNNGNGTFTDVSPLLKRGLNYDPLSHAGFQAGWVDINNDGRLDLYLANDWLTSTGGGNQMWRNDGPGTTGWMFLNISKASGTGYVMNSMGLGIGDYNRDGLFDLAISNIGPNVLARNNGDATFTNVAAQARVDRPWAMDDMPSMTWGPEFADFNNDGWEDLYIAQGMNNNDPNMTLEQELFVNAGDGTFYDLSAPSGAIGPATGRTPAVADYNRDGQLDLYLVQQLGSPILYRNVTPMGSNHWLEVLPQGTKSNRDGCGARFVLTLSNGAKLLRAKFCGSTGLGSGEDPAVHFGLGTDSTPVQLDIYWPSGTHQVIQNPAVDQLLNVVESP
ncbi:MAG TPA: CRTAC1 family protein, partial [Actinomycetota bacterium]